MKLTCTQTDLARGLAIVGRAVASRAMLPVLGNILLEAQDGSLRLAATNLELGITYCIEAVVEQHGATTVPAKTLTELVQTLPSTDIDLSVPEDTAAVIITTSASRTTIRGIDASEFPAIRGNDKDSEAPVQLPVVLLKEMIACVMIAASEDDARPVFCGVLVEMHDERLTFAAADAFRLAVRRAPQPFDDAFHSNLLIPARTLKELARILPDEGIVEMIVTQERNQVVFRTDTLTLVSHLINGTFPNYRAIIPKDHATRAVLDTREFAAHVKRAAIFARDGSNSTRLTISSGSGEAGMGKLTIEANADDLGDNVGELDARVEGPDQHMIFNVRYLSDVLAVLDAKEVALEVNAATKPGVIRPVMGEDDEPVDYLYLMMPMTVNER